LANLDRRSALVRAIAQSRARRVEREHLLIPTGDLEAQLVHGPRRRDRLMRHREHVVAIVEERPATFRNETAPRFEVLVVAVGIAIAERQALPSSQTVIELRHQLIRRHIEWHMSRLDRKTSRPQ
jgi:hypothetical protein